MGQYASNRSLKPTGRTLVRVVLTEEEALRILFLTRSKQMAESGACEVVIAEFIYGPMFCGVSGTKKVPGELEGEQHFVCDKHFKKYVYSIRPNPKDYDDWDEEKYHNDVLEWEKIWDQI